MIKQFKAVGLSLVFLLQTCLVFGNTSGNLHPANSTKGLSLSGQTSPLQYIYSDIEETEYDECGNNTLAISYIQDYKFQDQYTSAIGVSNYAPELNLSQISLNIRHCVFII